MICQNVRFSAYTYKVCTPDSKVYISIVLNTNSNAYYLGLIYVEEAIIYHLYFFIHLYLFAYILTRIIYYRFQMDAPLCGVQEQQSKLHIVCYVHAIHLIYAHYFFENNFGLKHVELDYFICIFITRSRSSIYTTRGKFNSIQFNSNNK